MTIAPIAIRPLSDYGEMKRAVDFQRLIWGAGFTELVPAVVFWFASRTGGIVAGAFDDADTMVAFLFGMTGWDGARPIHWSDMLAVLPSHRGQGLGFALKRYQRDRLLETGVTTVSWTFDPLEARNAHLNFARLGVTSHEYIRDAYGASSSPLHEGIGTDRLVVTWALDSPRVRGRMEGNADPVGYDDGEEINPGGGALRFDLTAPRVWLRVPGDIQTLKGRDPESARRWREETRAAFEAYLGRGYEVRELVRDGEGGRYLLETR
jgi:predicted GNAT superfamily acetyltransferase